MKQISKMTDKEHELHIQSLEKEIDELKAIILKMIEGHRTNDEKYCGTQPGWVTNHNDMMIDYLR